MEKISGIYCIENLFNGKKYIGQSKDIYIRWRSHKNKLRCQNHKNKYLQQSWNKYQEDNFKFYILEKCDDDLLDEREIFYINFFKSKNQDYGYNLADGGLVSRGWKLSEERKKHLSEIFTGQKLSEVRCNSIIKGQKRARKDGHWNPGVPINCYNCNGELVNTFDSIKEASVFLGLTHQNISKCLNLQRKTCGNFVFYNVDFTPTTEEIKNRFKKEVRISKPVIQVDRIGNILNEFASIIECFKSQTYYNKYDLVKVQCRGIAKSKIDYVYIYKHLYDPEKLDKYFKN